MTNEIVEKEPVDVVGQTSGEPHGMTVATDNSPAAFVKMAIEKNLDTDKLKELMALEKEWRATQAKAAFDHAMAEFNRIKPVIKHNRKGKTAGSAPFTYSDYPQMVKTVTPLMGQCGLSFTHYRERIDGVEHEVCKVSHEAGHSQENEFPILTDPRLDGKVSPMQLRQLAVTYAKRQSLAEALGLATEEDNQDDDSVREPVELVSEEQALNIRALLDEVGGEDKLLAWGKIDKVSDIPASKYDQVIKSLEKRRKE